MIRCKQNALRTGDTARYKAYRNKVQQMAKQLRRKYYACKVRALRECDPRNWWRNIKQITGLQSKSAEPLMALANQLHDGSTEELASQHQPVFPASCC